MKKGAVSRLIFYCTAYCVNKMQNQKSKSNEDLLSTVKPSSAIVNLAIPATLALLAKAVYNIVDTAYIGMLKDDIALAAVGVTVPLLLIMVSVKNIFAAGSGYPDHSGLCMFHQEDESNRIQGNVGKLKTKFLLELFSKSSQFPKAAPLVALRRGRNAFIVRSI